MRMDNSEKQSSDGQMKSSKDEGKFKKDTRIPRPVTGGGLAQQTMRTRSAQREKSSEVETEPERVKTPTSVRSQGTEGSRHKIGSFTPRDRWSNARPASGAEAGNKPVEQYRRNLLRFNKDSKDAAIIVERIKSSRQAMLHAKEEIIQMNKELPNPMPDLPEWLHNESCGQVKGGSLEEVRAEMEAEKKLVEQRYHEATSRLDLVSQEYLNNIKTLSSQIPKMESDYQNAAEDAAKLEKIQASLEQKIEEFNKFKNNFLLGQDSEMFQKQLEKERESHKHEMRKILKELFTARENLDKETDERKGLEQSLAAVKTEKALLEENCAKFLEQLERLKQLIPQSDDPELGAVQALNRQLIAEMEQLYPALKAARREIDALIEQKQMLQATTSKMEEENNCLKEEVVTQCRLTLFNKESQIFKLKEKMDVIVGIKNIIENNDVKGEYNLQAALLLDDADSLKKEVASLHGRWSQSRVEAGRLEAAVVQSQDMILRLEAELAATQEAAAALDRRSQLEAAALSYIGNIPREYENIDLNLLNKPSLQLNGGEGALETAMRQMEKYKGELGSLVRRLADLERSHNLCSERRTRNEQRIAMLEFNLAKYE